MKSKYLYDDSFAHTITSTYGAAGASWLEQLPTRIEQCAGLWHLTDLKPFENLTYNYVLSGMQQGVPIVLKLRCETADIRKEVIALTAFQNHGGVKLLDHDEQLGALLLERIMPGFALTELFPQNDAKATRIAAMLLQTINRIPVSSISFLTLEKILPRLTNHPQQLASFLPKARELRNILLSTQQVQVALHGDFHHSNILSAGDEKWVIIDPNGFVGDPIYDLAVFILNPTKELVVLPYAQQIVTERIQTFAAILGYPTQRIYDWVYLKAVCSAYWLIKDGLDANNHVKFLRILEDICI